MLTYVIKESLRIDPPLSKTHAYRAIQDKAEINGVEIRKDTLVTVNILAAHYNLNQWKNPKEFIPERFNPLSEYF